VNDETRLKKLQWAIHGVTAPFSSAGSFVPEKPFTVVFRDKSRFTVNRAENYSKQDELLRPLMNLCQPATFGDKRQTRLDRNVRDALQLKADKGGFAVENFDPEAAGILDLIQRQMLPHESEPISAELYAINVYSSGGHFAPHKDTPRGQDMFGTLVVCLPSRFYRGEFVLSHRGVVQRFDWGREIGEQQKESQIHWVAFFGDVDHQIEKVWMGARVTVTYLLRRESSDTLSRTVPDEDLASTITEAWRELLADDTFLPEGGIVGYPCCHLYHQDARFQVKQTPLDASSANMLKGRDQLVAAASLQADLKVTFAPYLFENCVDETWQLDRFPTSQEQKKMKRQMDGSQLQSAMPIHGASSEKVGDFGVTWLEDPPTSRSGNVGENSKSVTSSELPTAAHLHSCEYCEWGNFGNEASEVDFYIYAALHVQFPKLGEGRRANMQPSTPTKKKKAWAKSPESPATSKSSPAAKKSLPKKKARKKSDGR